MMKEQPIFEHTTLIFNTTFASHVRPLSQSGPVNSYPLTFGVRLGLRKYLN
jgi:hypothetical protein